VAVLANREAAVLRRDPDQGVTALSRALE
jgi:hypothetical protein